MNKKLILGVTIGGSSRLLDGQAKYFRNLGYQVFLISQNHYKETVFCNKEEITHLPINITNDINIAKDFISLIQIIRHFRKVKPDIVNVGTPKMGMLGTLAAFIARVPQRIYTCRGLRFETEKGYKRWLLLAMERFTVSLAQKVIYVSPSLRDAALKYGTCKPEKSVVIGKGSSNGIDLGYFNRDKIDTGKLTDLIGQNNLSGKFVIGFVGRVSLHKGVYELVDAFEKIEKLYPDTRLVLMGHIDCSKEFENRFRANPSIIHIPFQDDVPLYMSLFNILALPSWREGFPNVPIQAAAMGLPVIVSDATGCVDSVKNGFNGLVFPVRNTCELQNTIIKYLDDTELRHQHGKNGLLWANNFKPEVIWEGLHKLYNTK